MRGERIEYSPIIDRKSLKLPGNARVAIWVIVNVEQWDIKAPMARTVLPAPQGVSVIPDIPNFSWYDYGLRVGFWRLKRVLDGYQVKATLSLNAAVCNTYPILVEESLKSDWEILAHGFVQRALNVEKDERDVIRRTIQTIRDFTGRAPRGWMGPGLNETFDTLDILAEEGIEYVADWVNDDQPYPLKVKGGTLIALPYTVEINDIPIFLIQHHRSSEIYERARDQFDTLYEEGSETARFMAIAVHPYLTGVPHRIGYFEQIFQYIKEHDGVVFMRGSDILEWYRKVANQ